jgi:hypothetical protein
MVELLYIYAQEPTLSLRNLNYSDSIVEDRVFGVRKNNFQSKNVLCY